MNFAGWEKVSLVDYPGKIALTLFSSGCNFDCAYCHNQELKKPGNENLEESTIIEYIEKRRNLIDGVVFTGGEPSLLGDRLIDFMKRLKKFYPEKLLKLDTNGSNPLFVEKARGVLDFLAMDLKATDYSLFSSISMDTIKESLRIVGTFEHHEIRITVYPPYIKEEDFSEFAELLTGIKYVAVQQYRPVDNISPYPSVILRKFEKFLELSGLKVKLRL